MLSKGRSSGNARIKTSSAVKKAAKKQLKRITKRTRSCGAPTLGGPCTRELEDGQSCYWHPDFGKPNDDEETWGDKARFWENAESPHLNGGA